jgi:hypothetical protein
MSDFSKTDEQVHAAVKAVGNLLGSVRDEAVLVGGAIVDAGKMVAKGETLPSVPEIVKGEQLKQALAETTNIRPTFGEAVQSIHNEPNKSVAAMAAEFQQIDRDVALTLHLRPEDVTPSVGGASPARGGRGR